ncbi:hypothetical protein I551_9125 [Mycobacterium ulcerans str. Harvey]|nr:hypothetical protein I551_9125 [Mycobacterium ulcerans str. Harvey]
MSWLARAHPDLVGTYRELYRRGAYLPPYYRDMLRQRVAPLVAKHRLGGTPRPSSPVAEAEVMPVPEQATLF